MRSDKYDVTELLSSLETEKQATAFRNRLLAWGLGLIYIFIGLYGWIPTTQSWHLGWQVGGFLLALAAWPIILGIYGKLNQQIGDWPRCHECDAKLISFFPAIRRCPNCHTVIANDSRPFKAGYSLPGENVLKPRNPNQKTYTIGSVVGQLLVMLILAAIIVSLKLLAGEFQQNNLPEFIARLVICTGIVIIMISGVAPLFVNKLEKMLRFIDSKYERINRKLDKNYRGVSTNSERCCPYCNKEPNHRIVAVTGNCTNCGAHICEIATEPDTEDMMDWKAVQRYSKVSCLNLCNLGLVTFPGVFVFSVLERLTHDYWLTW